MWYTHRHTHARTHTVEYHSAIKNDILPFTATWMDLEGIMLSEKERDKYCLISLTCGIQKIQQTSEYNKTETDSQIQRTK